jgi:hypothetical protein
MTIYLDPNNFSIDLPFSRRLPVSRITLASIELPLTQYIIEVNANQIYFSEALDIIINNIEFESLKNFTIEEHDGSLLQIQFLPYLNPIKSINPIGTLVGTSDTITFTTYFLHSIKSFGDIYDSWGLSYPMTLINTLLNTLQGYNTTIETVTRLVPLKNPYLTINFENEFSITLPPDFNRTITFTDNNKINSYVYSLGIPSPAFLANSF